MAFLDDLGKKLSTAADLAETGKKKLDIAAEERELQSLYAQIGKAVYYLEKDNGASIYAAECRQITEHLQRIAAMQEEDAAGEA